jgi:hypothetical protein
MFYNFLIFGQILEAGSISPANDLFRNVAPSLRYTLCYPRNGQFRGAKGNKPKFNDVA